MRFLSPRLALACVFAAALAGSAHAITVDGRLEPGYSLLSTQTTQTNPGPDPMSGQVDFSTGSELDAAYGVIDHGVLHLLLAGNLKDALCGGQACTDFGALEVFIDSQPGGQNVLLGLSPSGAAALAGLTFDSGFTPDFVVEFITTGALSNAFRRDVWYGTLPGGGGGSAYLLGSGTTAGVADALAGGTNPYGIEATVDNSNTGGVTAGCSAASGAGVSSGVELEIPLAAIGLPTDCVSVCALVVEPQHNDLVNQVLGPVPPATCAFGAASGVNFAGIAGNQYFQVCPPPTPARVSSWGALKTVYR